MESSPPKDGFRTLTAKQRAVLDLLIEHKTSKEIARILKISPYTVDQRISAARKKTGVTSRNELASLYRATVEMGDSISQRVAYRFPHVEFPNAAGHHNDGAGAKPSEQTRSPISTKRNWGDQPEEYFRVVPEIFEGRFGIWFRLMAICLIAMMLLLVVLSGLATFGQLSELIV